MADRLLGIYFSDQEIKENGNTFANIAKDEKFFHSVPNEMERLLIRAIGANNNIAMKILIKTSVKVGICDTHTFMNKNGVFPVNCVSSIVPT